MGIVIGVVVHDSRRALFEEAAAGLAGVALEWVGYRREAEVRERVAATVARTHLDGLLLGPVPYEACRDLLPAGLALAITRPSALDLALAFGRARAAGRPPVPVSVDTFGQDVVDEVAGALGLDTGLIAALPYAPEQTGEDVVAFHRAALDRQGGYLISARTAVKDRLGDRALVLNGSPVLSSVRTDLHGLAMRVESERASALRFAAGIFLPVAPDERAHPADKVRVALTHLLVETPEFADAWVEDRDQRGVLVLAHKALFERVTRGWVAVPALAHAEEALGTRVAAGFGVGGSARNGVLLAERALARAVAAGGGCGFLVDDSGVVIGPMGGAGHALTGEAGAGDGDAGRDGTGDGDTGRRPALRFRYREHGAALERLARAATLSPATLSRLVALERSLAGRPVTPGELAVALAITDPSGRRLIRKLAAAGLVAADGSAQSHARGRPTRLYRLGIIAALASPSVADRSVADRSGVKLSGVELSGADRDGGA